MTNELTTYLATLGETLARLNIGFLVADGVGRIDHTNQVLMRVLAADPDRERVEHALRRVVIRLGDSPPADEERTLGTIANQPAIEVRTNRAHYRVCASRVGSRVYALLTQLAANAERPVATLPNARLLAERFRLTHRESDVALLLARGRSNADIAVELRISPFTARRHTERVLMKLNARSRSEVSAVMLGLQEKAG